MQFEALGHLAASAVQTHLLACPNSHAYSRPATWSRDAWDHAIAGKSTVDAQLGMAQVSIPQVHALARRHGFPPIFVEISDHYQRSEGLVQFRVTCAKLTFDTDDLAESLT